MSASSGLDARPTRPRPAPGVAITIAIRAVAEHCQNAAIRTTNNMLFINRLNSHLSLGWPVQSFTLSLFPVVKGKIAESAVEFDMVKWMNAKPIPAFLNSSPLLDQELLYFPVEVTKQTIVNYLNEKLNFKVTAEGKTAKKTKNQGPRVKKIKIICERGQIYKDQLGKRGQERKCTIKTTKPIVPEHRCTMYFITYEQEDGRMFVRKNGGCNWAHNYHIKPPKNLMPDGISAVPDDTLEKAKKLLSENMDVFLTASEMIGGLAPADQFDANLNTAVNLQHDEVVQLSKKYASEPKQKKRKVGSNPYTDNMGRYEHLMKLVTSEAEQNLVNDFWNQMEESLYRGKKDNCTH